MGRPRAVINSPNLNVYVMKTIIKFNQFGKPLSMCLWFPTKSW